MNRTRLVAVLESPIGVAVVRWSVRILFALSLVAWFVMGADRPPDPRFADEPEARRPVDGFGEVAFRVDPPDRLRSPSTTGARCALKADTPEQRAQGMQRRDDFSGYDGMVFLFDGDSQGEFVNHFVPIGLSIAWFDADGRFVSAADMPPCPDGVDCPLYGATGPYRTALEVPMGGLRPLGIADGARITVGGPC